MKARALQLDLFVQGEPRPAARWLLLIHRDNAPVELSPCVSLDECYSRIEREQATTIEIFTISGRLFRSFGEPRNRPRRKGGRMKQLNLSAGG